MTRVAIYLRISDDRDGTQTATQRQRADCIRFAESRDWDVVDVFEDVDLSAYKRGTKRPEFERMLTAVRDQDVDGVLAWKIDRLTRRMRDFVRLDEACEDSGGFIATVSDGIDTRNPASRFIAEILVSQARMESQNQSTRITRKEAERAANGLPATGGDRLYGYTSDRSHIIPEEAALVREAAARILAGETLNGVCWDWKRRGVKSVRGGSWSKQVMRRYLMRPAIAGFREHEGVLVKGTWPGLISEVDHRRLVALLSDPARLTRTTARRYLLTGLVSCGNCGALLVGRPRDDKSPRYVCNRQPELPNCGRLTRLCEPVDEMVKELVLDALESVDLRQFVEDSEPDATLIMDAIRADEEALVELSADYYQHKVIDRAEFLSNRNAIRDRISDGRRRLARQGGRGILAGLVGAGATVREEWDARGIDWQRAVIAALVSNIELLPAVKGYNRFDPTKVRIEWKF